MAINSKALELQFTACLAVGAVFLTWGISGELSAQNTELQILSLSYFFQFVTGNGTNTLIEQLHESNSQILFLSSIIKYIGSGMILFAIFLGYILTQKSYKT